MTLQRQISRVQISRVLVSKEMAGYRDSFVFICDYVHHKYLGFSCIPIRMMSFVFLADAEF